ncbi:acyl transferase/acyl hydrolase/lysophospholipase [Dunaliella salina]|uniref:Patatin n=1 Tax=Dunaliella salina TaxID=3046 RepID=A0ABQ7G0A3_DUNSA|nr:acyl transferase/acyl hydrolase/lysophospholipase [Dunaliella salina]|eukprot:KAF5828033.1 acyl transferase/acyl hydrolase/lysophospholipase [Dunaliella salina]
MLRCLSKPRTGAGQSPTSKIDGVHSRELFFSFSGGGFLMPYFLGVVEVLKNLGIIKPGVTQVAGSSAGSLVAVGVSCGLDNDLLFECLLNAGKDCELGVKGRLGNALRKQLEHVLPPDAHIKCNGIAHVGITRLSTSPLLKSKIISQFSDRADLIQALLASCHLPVLSDGKMTTKFRGKGAMDGGLTALMPQPSTLPHQQVIKVSCLPLQMVMNMPLLNRKAALLDFEKGIAPGLYNAWPHTPEETFRFALNPQPREFLLRLMEAGRADAKAWLAASRAKLDGWPMLNNAPALTTEMAAKPGPVGAPSQTSDSSLPDTASQATQAAQDESAATILSQSTQMAVYAAGGGSDPVLR